MPTAEDMSNFLEGSGWDFAYNATRDQYFCDVCKEWIGTPGDTTRQGLIDHAAAVHNAVAFANRYQKR